jgi:hypothetical protein
MGAAGLPISEHIQHGAKLGALSQEASSMTVHSIQQPRQDVTPRIYSLIVIMLCSIEQDLT